MPEIDDFFVNTDISQINLNNVIEKYLYFKNSSIPDNYIKKYFGALLQDYDNKTLFKRKEISNSPIQEFWTLRFIDIAENNYDNINIKKYSTFGINDLKEIVNICFYDDRIKRAKEYLITKGIYLYFIDSLPGTKIDGAVCLTTFSTIAIGLTVRFERLDYLWFTLLHELAHLILHLDLLNEGIISIEDSQEKIEVESNRLAKESIISPEKYRVCLPKRTLETDDLYKYAKNNNIHPALLAGIIRRDLYCYNKFSDIIDKYKLKRSDLYD
jgi:HTH-type transcriptional regulator/antitoxin HigA